MITNAHLITVDMHAILIGALVLLPVIIAFLVYQATGSKKERIKIQLRHC